MAMKLPIRSYDRQVSAAITPIEYGNLQKAFDHFNSELFANALPDCFITYQRQANSAGYFSPDRFADRVGTLDEHELALNPDGFAGQTDEQICQTLAHEMTHAWQHHCGKPPARGYHDRQWAAKMKEIGLHPSSTGTVGGKETGQKMADYVIPGGRFADAFAKLAATGWRLNLQSAHRQGKAAPPNNSKRKFTCPGCGQNAWGRPDLAIDCRLCGFPMTQKPSEDLTGGREAA
jgi:predicted SprT family Zn-dependent metalloprotease/ribosomal protein L37E